MARKERTLRLLVSSAPVAILLAALGCQGSSSVTGPASGTAAANIAGAWNGTFQSDDVTACGNSSAFASLQQQGSEVTGTLKTSDCGIAGYFKGTLSGYTLTGSISMEGCVGGKFSGSVTTTGISLSIGDLTKPLVTGDAVVMSGGIVTLAR